MKTSESKLSDMKLGIKTVLSTKELDEIELISDDNVLRNLRTLPNPNRCGILDEYIGWIE